MLLRLAFAAATAFMAALPAFAAEPPTQTAGGLTLVDLTPMFAETFDRTAGLDETARAAAFKAQFAQPLPGFYDEARFKGSAERFQRQMSRGLAAFPDQRAGIAQVSARFGEMFRPALASFESEFGPMEGYPPIFLVDSLGEFDGGTRDLTDGNHLMFGADVIARLHLGHRIQPFFHHELFHIYHGRRFPECDQVWCGLWAEGLAVYVAQSLNPDATDDELLLTFPEPIRPAVEKDRKAAVCAVAARLDSRSEDDLNALFSMGRLSAELPPRFGYYVGYLVACEQGRTHTLKALAAMPAEEVRPMLQATLATLAGGCD